jgi:hypothetical protein
MVYAYSRRQEGRAARRAKLKMTENKGFIVASKSV